MTKLIEAAKAATEFGAQQLFEHITITNLREAIPAAEEREKLIQKLIAAVTREVGANSDTWVVMRKLRKLNKKEGA